MHTEVRSWGYFNNLYANENCKIKMLVIAPKHGISYQRHFEREELWMVKSGIANIRYSTSPGESWKSINLKLREGQTFHVGKGWWHQLWNEENIELKILEVQFGSKCVEQDIERIEDGIQT